MVEAAGPWDTSLHYDQDGEFFCRVLLASEGVRFVPGTGIYYRISGRGSISFIGHSDQKKDSLLRSVKLHVQYLRSLEDTDRVRKACLTYLQKYYFDVYPERPDIVAELQRMASQMGGRLEEPRLSWKYTWLRTIMGYTGARDVQLHTPYVKASLLRSWDKAMFRLEKKFSTN
jgi:hypothetical protein